MRAPAVPGLEHGARGPAAADSRDVLSGEDRNTSVYVEVFGDDNGKVVAPREQIVAAAIREGHFPDQRLAARVAD